MLYKNIFYLNKSFETADDLEKKYCLLDVHVPRNSYTNPVLIWFHGGSFKKGTRRIPKKLQNSGMIVVSAGYRLYPHVKFPTYLEDAAQAINWVFKHIEEYCDKKTPIFLSGHSAGAYLSTMLLLDSKWLKPYKITAKHFSGLIALSTHAITHHTVREEQKIPPLQIISDHTAPIFYARTSSPPIVLITGDRELELYGRHEENIFFEKMLKLNGHKQVILHELKGEGHNMVKAACPLVLSEVQRLLAEKTTKTCKSLNELEENSVGSTTILQTKV